MAEQKITCGVCPHACVLSPGQLGLCRARRADGGMVRDENYGRLTSLALDPIEKKPIACWRPGSFVLSVGSYGCNLRCPFCQNASIACAGEDDVSWREVSPVALVEAAQTFRAPRGGGECIGIAYTYNEPLIGWEYVRDCSVLAHEAGLANVLVSNGYANEPVIRALAGLVDAANIDLKAFNNEFYRMVGGDLATVKRTIELLAADPACHLEVTTLIIPGLNDDPEEMDAEAAWLASLNPDIPLHLTRYFPCHRLTDRPPTPRDTLETLAGVARRHLHDVLLGNV